MKRSYEHMTCSLLPSAEPQAGEFHRHGVECPHPHGSENMGDFGNFAYSRLQGTPQPAPFHNASSSSSLSDTVGFFADSAQEFLAERARRVTQRTSIRHASPGLSQSNYTTTLQDILTRYHNYQAAKAAGRIGASKEAIASLKQKRCSAALAKENNTCTLCLEELKQGEMYITLECGHTFHAGNAKVRKNSTKCRGILYWLDNQRTCPHCRSELEPAIPAPHPSEQIIVPLLNRQFALIQAQSRLIERQRREIQLLHERQSAPPTSAMYPNSYQTPEVVNPQWQNPGQHHQIRVNVLNHVTEIAVAALNWRILSCSATKLRKLNNLAAKVELLLYSEASNLDEYKNMVTLKERTLKMIKRLICRAKYLKAQRSGNNVAVEATPIFSL